MIIDKERYEVLKKNIQEMSGTLHSLLQDLKCKEGKYSGSDIVTLNHMIINFAKFSIDMEELAGSRSPMGTAQELYLNKIEHLIEFK